MRVTENRDLEGDRLVVLMNTQSEPEANIIKGLLEESGIDCTFITPVPHNIYPFTVDGLALIQIKVLASQFEAARKLLSDYQAKIDLDEIDFSEDSR